jgi:ligand-binding SRPBCC domain-containing protein
MFVFEAELWLPRPRCEVFEFFSDAGNLETLTPPWLNFHIVTPRPIAMHAGTLIDYRLRIRGIPAKWRTRISVWEPPHRFVDEQLRGPYRRWHHTHTFEEHEDGTLCRDRVEYDMIGGRLVNWLLVRRDVETIFAYRRRRLQELFPAEREAASVAPR